LNTHFQREIQSTGLSIEISYSIFQGNKYPINVECAKDSAISTLNSANSSSISGLICQGHVRWPFEYAGYNPFIS